MHNAMLCYSRVKERLCLIVWYKMSPNFIMLLLLPCQHNLWTSTLKIYCMQLLSAHSGELIKSTFYLLTQILLWFLFKSALSLVVSALCGHVRCTCDWSCNNPTPHKRDSTLELETKVKRRFTKVSIVSYIRLALMIIASASQFHVYLPWGQRPFSIVS